MRTSKLTQKHYINIIAITSACIQDYANFTLRCAKFVQENEQSADAENDIMHFEDLLYVQTALNNFINNKDVAQLQDDLMSQDTFVREYYIDTLRYIEDNNLVTNYYCTF